MAQKKKLKVPKIKGIKSSKKPTKPSPALIRKILRGPLFWIVAALIAVSIFGQISTTGKEFIKVETSTILNEISKDNVKSAIVIDRDQKVRVVLKDGEFVDGASKLEASYIKGQESVRPVSKISSMIKTFLPKISLSKSFKILTTPLDFVPAP